MDAAGAAVLLLAFCASAKLPKLSINMSASTKLITFLTVAFSFLFCRGGFGQPLWLGKTAAPINGRAGPP